MTNSTDPSALSSDTTAAPLRHGGELAIRSPRGVDIELDLRNIGGGTWRLSTRGASYLLAPLSIGIGMSIVAVGAALTRRPSEPWAIVAYAAACVIVSLLWLVYQLPRYSVLQIDTVRGSFQWEEHRLTGVRTWSGSLDQLLLARCEIERIPWGSEARPVRRRGLVFVNGERGILAASHRNESQLDESCAALPPALLGLLLEESWFVRITRF